MKCGTGEFRYNPSEHSNCA